MRLDCWRDSGGHLALCSQFYKTGHGGPWWMQALEALEEGMLGADTNRESQDVPLSTERLRAPAYCKLNICSVWTSTPLGVVTSDSDVSVFPSGDTVMCVVTAGRPEPSIRTL